MKGKYLITTDNWFIDPNGKLYRSVWGDVQIIEDSFLGIKTNSKSSNWYAKVGSEENHVIVAGCQIHYACKSENKPNVGKILEYSADASGHSEYERPTQIYIAE